jgi:uncharacterized membrane protein YdjX (TVP38/TMEM64 family)
VKKYKTFLKIIWVLIIGFGLVAFISFPEYFKGEKISSHLHENYFLITAFYIFLVCIRGLFFIPSTVFIIMGLAIYPEEPIFIILINLLGVLIGGLLLYGAANYFTEESFFSEKKQRVLNKARSKMQQYGFPIVMLWSFFPAVPTDIICYVAGAVKMKLIPFILALLIGESILITIYVYSGKSLIELVF